MGARLAADTATFVPSDLKNLTAGPIDRWRSMGRGTLRLAALQDATFVRPMVVLVPRSLPLLRQHSVATTVNHRYRQDLRTNDRGSSLGWQGNPNTRY